MTGKSLQFTDAPVPFPGVQYIFSYPDGREVRSVSELLNGHYYVCSWNRQLEYVNYGDQREHQWRGGKVKHDENHLFKDRNGTVISTDIIIVVVVVFITIVVVVVVVFIVIIIIIIFTNSIIVFINNIIIITTAMITTITATKTKTTTRTSRTAKKKKKKKAAKNNNKTKNKN